MAAQPPTDFEPCEKIVVPQKLYYRRGSLHTVASELIAKKIALFSNRVDLDIMTLAQQEFSNILDLETIYPVLIDENDHNLCKIAINNVLPSVDTVVAVGSSKLFNEVAMQLNKNIKQLVIIPTDAKPLALMTGCFVDEDGKIVHNELLVPEMVILDSGVTKHISKEDCLLLQSICAVEEDTQWVQFTKTAQEISKELVEGYGKIDHPVWCERCTNLVGICMLGKPNGTRVLKALGLAK